MKTLHFKRRVQTFRLALTTTPPTTVNYTHRSFVIGVKQNHNIAKGNKYFNLNKSNTVINHKNKLNK